MTMSREQRGQVSDLRVAVMRLSRRLRNERTDDRLTPSQMAVLGTVMRQGPMSPGELAESERVQPPSMTRILRVLADGGWIVKQPHPEDGRQVLVDVTEPAREWLRAERERRDQWLCTRLEGLAPAERETVFAATRLLNRIACSD